MICSDYLVKVSQLGAILCTSSSLCNSENLVDRPASEIVSGAASLADGC